ncbi:MAG: hypothetical protein HYZ49_13050 [Chloroflexi bacterium]|nr:hypothetical protein [Chloroflexota bacterium]
MNNEAMNNEQLVIDRAFKTLAAVLLLASVAFNALKVAPIHANEFAFGVGAFVLSLIALPEEKRR